MIFRNIIGLVAILAAGAAIAQDKYPSRPIELIVPFGAGGAVDLTARALGSVAAQHLGQPLVITMRPGGSGVIGASLAARAKPDGYTLMLGGTTPVTVAPQLENAGYNNASFVAVAHVNQLPSVVALKADKPWKTLQELLGFIRADPAKIVYGTSSVSGVTNLGNQMLLRSAGITAPLTTVPYKSVGEHVLSVLRGETDYMVQIAAGLMPHVQAKQMRILAVLSDKRFQFLPDVPTAKELGYDVVSVNWIGILAPRGTPADIVTQLSATFGKMMADPAFVAMALKTEMPPSYMPAPEFQRFLDAEYKKYGELIDRAGLRKK
jgi:tripartite-type tricarboxylate transporter receptor subunit TctC